MLWEHRVGMVSSEGEVRECVAVLRKGSQGHFS